MVALEGQVRCPRSHRRRSGEWVSNGRFELSCPSVLMVPTLSLCSGGEVEAARRQLRKGGKQSSLSLADADSEEAEFDDAPFDDAPTEYDDYIGSDLTSTARKKRSNRRGKKSADDGRKDRPQEAEGSSKNLDKNGYEIDGWIASSESEENPPRKKRSKRKRKKKKRTNKLKKSNGRRLKRKRRNEARGQALELTNTASESEADSQSKVDDDESLDSDSEEDNPLPPRPGRSSRRRGCAFVLSDCSETDDSESGCSTEQDHSS